MAVAIVLISILAGFLGVTTAVVLWDPGLLMLIVAYWVGGMLGSFATIVLLMLRMPDAQADADTRQRAPAHLA